MARHPFPTRLALLGTLALALALPSACGDDGSDDTAAGTTAAPASGGSTTADSTTTEAAEAESTGLPAECEVVSCGDGELCIVPGPCPNAPSCAAADMVVCDFTAATCSLEDVCSGRLQGGAFVCETCS